MEYQEVFSVVAQAILEELEDLRREDIIAEANLQEDLEIDSLSITTIIAQLEDEIDVQVPDEQIEKFVTVSDLVEYLQELKN